MRGRAVKNLLSLLALSLLVSACGDEEGSEAVTERAQATASEEESTGTWTVLVYLCGSDLESEDGMASWNLEEMCDAPASDKVNVVIETGGADSWERDDIDPSVLQRFALQDGELVLQDELPSASMGEADTLADFLTWGAETYPAEQTAVILWDHGGANAEGVCYDERYDWDPLTREELTEAFSEAPVTFDLIGFDACLMGSLETAVALQDAGEVLVASEGTEPGYGWDYTALLSALAENSDLSAASLGQVICDSFLAKCESWDVADQATLSVIDLAAIPQVDEAFFAYAGGMAKVSENMGTLAETAAAARHAETFGGSTAWEGYSNMLDLTDLVQKTKDAVPADPDPLLASLDGAILYEVHGDSRDAAEGLSVFYPLDVTEEEFSAYAASSENVPYLQYLAAVTGNYDTIDWTLAWEDLDQGEVETGGSETDSIAAAIASLQDELIGLAPAEEDETLSYEQALDEDGYFNLAITGGYDSVVSVHFLLYYAPWAEEDDPGTEVVYLGEDNDLDADWEAGRFSDRFAGNWMTIGGELVCAELLEETERYNLYAIPCTVDGEETSLRAVYDGKDGTYRVLGRYDGAEDGILQGRGVQPLEEGSEIVFTFYSYDFDTDEEGWYETNPITWDDTVVMEDAALGDGFYWYQYEIGDLYGNVTDTDPVLMEVLGDAIYPYKP